MVKILSIFVAFLENTNFNLTTSMMSNLTKKKYLALECEMEACNCGTSTGVGGRG